MKKRRNQRLLEILQDLPDAQAGTLLEFAEFLLAKSAPEKTFEDPIPIERPAEETVVFAIKRLRATYPMIDPAKILHDTAGLMAQHLLQGRNRTEVIDELEILFRRHFDDSRSSGRSG